MHPIRIPVRFVRDEVYRPGMYMEAWRYVHAIVSSSSHGQTDEKYQSKPKLQCMQAAVWCTVSS